MKKTLLLVLSAIFALSLSAETMPAGYYDAIQGKQDSILKNTLFNIVRGGERYVYGPNQFHTTDDPQGRWKKGDFKAYGTWGGFMQTDRRADGTIWDMYSSSKRYFVANGTTPCTQDIEHCLPKSWWGGGTDTKSKADSIYRDLYNLNPADKQANSSKNNYPPGHVVKGDKFDNGCFRMDKHTSSQYGYFCFEPAEEYRGDFARAYFYMVTAYEDRAWNTQYADYCSEKSYLFFSDAIIQVLLDWHRADPVSRKELERLEAISTIQHNRNCYIDYPELVEYIWGNKKGQQVSLSNLTWTGDPSYVPAESMQNLEAYAPKDLEKDGFTAVWSPTKGDYQLDVYTRSWTGSNDTIVNLPGLKHDWLFDQEHTTCTPKKSASSFVLQANGDAAVTMGNGDIDGQIMLRKLDLKAPARLVFRASVYNTANEGVLEIKLGDQVFKTISLPIENKNRSETYYDIEIPAGTDSITITSVGGSTTKRACMQQLFLIQGDLEEHLTSVDGFPVSLNTTSYKVTTPESLQGKTIYYRVVDSNNLASNEVEITIPVPQPTAIDNACNRPEVQKIIKEGQVIIIRDGVKYSVLGTRLD